MVGEEYVAGLVHRDFRPENVMIANLQVGRARWSLAIVGGVAGYGRYELRARTQACFAEGAAIDASWNDDVRRRVREGLLATGVSYAATTADRVMPYLDAEAEAWRVARTEACLDARVRERWDEDLLDRSARRTVPGRIRARPAPVPAQRSRGGVGRAQDAFTIRRAASRRASGHGPQLLRARIGRPEKVSPRSSPKWRRSSSNSPRNGEGDVHVLFPRP